MHNRKLRTYRAGWWKPAGFPGHEDPFPGPAGAGWGAFKRKVHASSRFAENPRAFAAWLRIQHDGWRFDDVCVWCGARVSPEEQRELFTLDRAFPRPNTLDRDNGC